MGELLDEEFIGALFRNRVLENEFQHHLFLICEQQTDCRSHAQLVRLYTMAG